MKIKKLVYKGLSKEEELSEKDIRDIKKYINTKEDLKNE